MKKTAQILFLYAFIISAINHVNSQINKETTTQVFVEFKIRNLGFNVEGHFKDVEMNVLFDENNLSKSSITGKVLVESIDTDIEKRDEHLKQEAYFDANTYPYIHFKSSKIVLKSKDTYDVTGELTIKNTTKTITIPFNIKKTSSRLDLSTYLEINRRDYHVGNSSLALSKTVKITITYLKK